MKFTKLHQKLKIQIHFYIMQFALWEKRDFDTQVTCYLICYYERTMIILIFTLRHFFIKTESYSLIIVYCPKRFKIYNCIQAENLFLNCCSCTTSSDIQVIHVTGMWGKEASFYYVKKQHSQNPGTQQVRQWRRERLIVISYPDLVC